MQNVITVALEFLKDPSGLRALRTHFTRELQKRYPFAKTAYRLPIFYCSEQLQIYLLAGFDPFGSSGANSPKQTGDKHSQHKGRDYGDSGLKRHTTIVAYDRAGGQPIAFCYVLRR